MKRNGLWRGKATSESFLKLRCESSFIKHCETPVVYCALQLAVYEYHIAPAFLGMEGSLMTHEIKHETKSHTGQRMQNKGSGILEQKLPKDIFGFWETQRKGLDNKTHGRKDNVHWKRKPGTAAHARKSRTCLEVSMEAVIDRLRK